MKILQNIISFLNNNNDTIKNPKTAINGSIFDGYPKNSSNNLPIKDDIIPNSNQMKEQENNTQSEPIKPVKVEYLSEDKKKYKTYYSNNTYSITQEDKNIKFAKVYNSEDQLLQILEERKDGFAIWQNFDIINGKSLLTNLVEARPDGTQYTRNIKYNSEGVKEEEVSYFDDMFRTIKYSYDENHKVSDIQMKTNIILTNGAINTTIEQYHSEESLENNTPYHKTSQIYNTTTNNYENIETEYQYDAQNRLIEANSDINGNKTKVKYEYKGTDKQPESITTESYSAENIKLFQINTEYSGHSRKHTKTIYDNNGNTVETIIKTYENNKISSVEKLNAQGKRTYYNENLQADGEITYFNQGGTGDCYFLSAINALNQSETGKKIIKDNISTDKDENGNTIYKVKFSGAEELHTQLGNIIPPDNINLQGYYTITSEELEMATNGIYSEGDRDVIILELAYQKLKKDLKSDILNNNLNKNIENSRITSLISDDPIHGGFSGESLYMLTGKKSITWELDQSKEIHQGLIISQSGELKVGPNIPVNSGLKYEENPENILNNLGIKTLSHDQIAKINILNKIISECKATGKLENIAATVAFKVKQEGGADNSFIGHEFSIKAITENEVILINPWDSEKEVTLSINDFLNTVNEINICELN